MIKKPGTAWKMPGGTGIKDIAKKVKKMSGIGTKSSGRRAKPKRK